MSREQIISELYLCKQIDNAIEATWKNCRKVYYNRFDFKQEVFLIIMQKEESFINQLHEKGQLLFYAVGIIINLARQKRNVFHRNYPDAITDYVDNYKEPADENNIEERRLREQKEIELINRIHNLDLDLNSPAYRLMVMLVNKLGSQSEVSRRTGIPVCVISRGIKKVRQHLCS